VEAAISRWRAAGASSVLVWGRWAVLRSAVSWAASRGLLRSNPLDVMRAPPKPAPRKHLLPSEVAALLATASAQVDLAAERVQAKPGDGQLLEALFVAEQTQLLFALPRTPAPAGANSPCSAWATWRAGC